MIEEGFQHGESVCYGDVRVSSLLQMPDEVCDTALVGDVEIILVEKAPEGAEGKAVTLLRCRRVDSLDKYFDEKYQYALG